ncbi:MAG: oligosaccharide flippase family protein [Saprospiraceae bacterium]|nr:oligosaccharide flippase family protein [Saprospiraceae bacterium]
MDRIHFRSNCLFIFTPILARLYLPENFGSLSVFTSVVVVLAIFSTGKFEYAILLPKNKTESFHITILGGILSVIFGLIAFITFGIINLFHLQIPFIENNFLYTFLVPFVIMFSGINSCVLYLLIRNEKYKEQSLFNFLQPIIIIGLNLSLGLLGYLKFGLIISFSISSIISCVLLLWILRKRI